jgi:hypothetical protein
MPSLSGLGKRPQGVLRNQCTRGLFGLSLVFKTVFGMFLAHLFFSEICLLRNVWKLPSSCLALIPYSEKTSWRWSLKTSFWKKSYLTNSKIVMKIFQA